MPDIAEPRTYLEQLALDLRKKAEAYRARARAIGNRAAKGILLGMAADTERLAAEAEARATLLRVELAKTAA